VSTPPGRGDRTRAKREAQDWGAFLLRLLLGALFIARLVWKFAILPGGLAAWWHGLVHAGYSEIVPAYVLSAELMGALLLIPGVQTRWVALYAVPMMAGAAQFWLARTGFYFTKAGAELPLVWLALLGLQIVLGDGALSLVKSTRLTAATAGVRHRRGPHALRTKGGD
jgi:putative oxidoreductase